jgi:hypothetical protein
MSWDFKPGMKVVCVDDSDCPYIAKGDVYTVEEVSFGSFKSCVTGKMLEAIGFKLEEVSVADQEWFNSQRFRPARTTSIESLRAHLNTLPVRKTVEA